MKRGKTSLSIALKGKKLKSAKAKVSNPKKKAATDVLNQNKVTYKKVMKNTNVSYDIFPENSESGSKDSKKGIRYVANKWRYSSPGTKFARDTASGKNKKFMNTFDFFQDSSGVYHTKQNCWQRVGGYNDIYDFFFGAATKMKAKKFKLPVSTSRFNLNKTYILWAWKGDYFNLGAGGENWVYIIIILKYILWLTRVIRFIKNCKLNIEAQKLLIGNQIIYLGG